MKIIQRRASGVHVDHHRSFDYVDRPGSGVGFACDEHGIIDRAKLAPAAIANLDAALAGRVNGHAVVDLGVRRYEHRYTTPAIGECACGQRVELVGFTNTCDCGRDYNMSGQLLAPREFWGEETGESVDDILAIQ